MTKKYHLNEARNKIRWAKHALHSDFQRKKEYFETAAEDNSNVVKFIEEAMTQYKGSKQDAIYLEWQNLLCEASFGKGLTEGLLEMKKKTYKTRFRPIRELESVVQELGNAFADLTREL